MRLINFVIILSTIFILTTVTTKVSFAEENKDSYQLFQTTEEITLDDSVTLSENTYLYGLQVENGIEIQYSNSIFILPFDSVISLIEIDNSPKFVEYDTTNYINYTIPENTTAYSDSSSFIFNKELEYPLTLNDNGNFTLILGNIEYVIKDQLYIKNENLTENNNTNNEGDIDTSKSKEIQQNILTSNETIGNKKEPEALSFNVKIQTSTNDNSQNKTWDNGSGYFKVIADGVTVNDIRSGKHVPVGELVKGQVYHRVGQSGNYHKIRFGNFYGYVYMKHTEWSDGKEIKNKNTRYKNTDRTFVAKDDIRVIDNSSGSFVTMGYIKKGTRFAIAENSGTNFWRVIYGDREGFVYKNQVNVDFKKSDNYFKVTDEGAIVYDIRNGKYIPVGELVIGQEYSRQGESGRYHKIKFGNYSGFVHMSRTEPSSGANIKNKNSRYSNLSRTFTAHEDINVIDNSSGSFVTMGIIKKGTEFAIAQNSGTDYWRVIYGDRVGFVKKDQTRTSFNNNDKYFQVTKDAPIYDIQSGKYVKIGEVTKGQYFPRLGSSGNYHQIRIGQFNGYVHFSNTVIAIGNNIKNEWKNEKNGYKSIIVKNNVNVIDNSSGKFVTMGTLEKGAELKVISESNNFVKIIFGNRIGNVNKNSVDIFSIKIMIDPGHGGSDPGAVGNGLQEKNINLDIARRVKALLEQSGYEVIMTRNTDTFIPLDGRSSLANNLNADLFVSIHTNSGGGQGIETYWYSKGPEAQKSKALAEYIQSEMIKETNARNRGVKDANFHVNRETKMESVLVEVGFIDNANDAAKLKTNSYKQQIAKGIANGIKKYLQMIF